MPKKIKIPTKDERRVQDLEEQIASSKAEIAQLKERESILQNDVAFILQALEG